MFELTNSTNNHKLWRTLMKKHFMVLVILLFGFSGVMSLAQTAKEDFKPNVTNQSGKEFPQVNSEGRVRASISAPEATKVQLDISAVKYDLVKDANGVWTGDS